MNEWWGSGEGGGRVWRMSSESSTTCRITWGVDQMRCMAIYFFNLFLKISEWWGSGGRGGGWGVWRVSWESSTTRRIMGGWVGLMKWVFFFCFVLEEPFLYGHLKKRKKKVLVIGWGQVGGGGGLKSDWTTCSRHSTFFFSFLRKGLDLYMYLALVYTSAKKKKKRKKREVYFWSLMPSAGLMKMSDCLVSFVIQHHLSLFTVIPYCFLLCWVSGQQSHSSNDLWKWGSQCWAPTTQILPSHSTTWQRCTMIANSMTRQNHSMRGRLKYAARSGCVGVCVCMHMCKCSIDCFFQDVWVCVCMCANATQAVFLGMCGSVFACVQMQHGLSFSGCVGLLMYVCKCNVDCFFRMCGSVFACVQMQHSLSFLECVGLCLSVCKRNTDYLFQGVWVCACMSASATHTIFFSVCVKQNVCH